MGQDLNVRELIILDDASTDDSQDVIRGIAATLSVPVKMVFNDANSGSIFSQWKKGLNLAQGDLIWICESDDSCDPGFLRALVPYFKDPSVMLAFGRIDFVDGAGKSLPEMNGHMENSEFWREPRVESAYAWFNGPFGARNVIANVGGCVFRRQPLSSDFMSELSSYRICGDWFFYSWVARSGRIAYDPAARSYFRLHTSNSSVASFKTEGFYEEHVRIAHALRRHYGIESSTLQLLLQNAWTRCVSNLGEGAARKFALKNPLRDILKERRTVRHIIMTMQGGDDGQVDLLLIHEANSLSQNGEDVSLLVREECFARERIRPLLSPEIPIFTREFMDNLGAKPFLRKFGVGLVCVRYSEPDGLFEACRELNVPYVVTARNIPPLNVSQEKGSNGFEPLPIL